MRSESPILVSSEACKQNGMSFLDQRVVTGLPRLVEMFRHFTGKRINFAVYILLFIYVSQSTKKVKC
jgi:hypothetical protein